MSEPRLIFLDRLGRVGGGGGRLRAGWHAKTPTNPYKPCKPLETHKPTNPLNLMNPVSPQTLNPINHEQPILGFAFPPGL